MHVARDPTKHAEARGPSMIAAKRGGVAPRSRGRATSRRSRRRPSRSTAGSRLCSTQTGILPVRIYRDLGFSKEVAKAKGAQATRAPVGPAFAISESANDTPHARPTTQAHSMGTTATATSLRTFFLFVSRSRQVCLSLSGRSQSTARGSRPAHAQTRGVQTTHQGAEEASRLLCLTARVIDKPQGC